MLEAYDDVTGLALDGKKCLEARQKEIVYVRQKGVWTKIRREVAKAKSLKIFKTRWIDINKGDDLNPALRSRFVGKEFNTGPMDGLFAATPPIEALRSLVSEAATLEVDDDDKVMEVDDVSRAFFEADVKRDVCIESPEEDVEDDERGQDLVGHLKKSLYGTRDAAMNWQEEIAKLLVADGFIRGKYNPCLYHHAGRKIRTLVHGDDFVTVGGRKAVKAFNKLLRSRFDIKSFVIGGDASLGDVQDRRVLNRVIRRTPEGFEMEADQRHAELMIESLGLSSAKGATTPGSPQAGAMTLEEEETDNALLSPEEATLFRSVGARANYLSQDRVDIMYATKEICRHMSSPRIVDMKNLKKLARYLIHRPRLVMRYNWQGREPEVCVYTDSDWAGDRKTGKSTSGGCITRGTHFIKGWCKTQQCVTLSSAEAELVAMNKGAADLLGTLSMYADVGECIHRGDNPGSAHVAGPGVSALVGVVCGDSSAAIAISQRRGVGKLRHINVGQLWIQERVLEKDVSLRKVMGEANPADLLTKHLSEPKKDVHCTKLSMVFEDGRATSVLQVQHGKKGNEARAL